MVLLSDAAGVARLAGRLAFGIAVPRYDPFAAPLLLAQKPPRREVFGFARCALGDPGRYIGGRTTRASR
jgi:hypothetical protein